MNLNQIVANGIKRLQDKGLLGNAERQGRTNSMFSCPFRHNHGGKVQQDTPSFSVNTTNGAWLCFNPACGEKGRSIHTLYAKLTGELVDKVEEDLGKVEIGTNDIRKRLLSRPEDVEPEMIGQFPGTDAITTFKRASDYMISRSIPPNVWERLHCSYHRLGYGGVDRIIFPLYWNGTLVGYSARAIGKVKEMKLYRPVKNIGHMFYDPLDLLGDAKYIGPVFLVEGEFDVAACVRENLPVMGCFQANIGEARAHYLQKFGSITLAFDGDDAGMTGSYKAIKAVGHLFPGRMRIQRMDDGGAKDPGEMPVGFGPRWMARLEDPSTFISTNGGGKWRAPKKRTP